LALCLLAPPRLECDGESLKLQYHKNVALLAYLAVTGETHTRESLITLLWPELDPSRTRANLRRNLSLLRKALNGKWLVVDGETIGPDSDADLWIGVKRMARIGSLSGTSSSPSRTRSRSGCTPSAP
jgi:DNA-binding SARP family transcriptional activator